MESTTVTPLRDLGERHVAKLPKIHTTKLPAAVKPRPVTVKVHKTEGKLATKVPYGMVPLIKDPTPRIPTVYTG